MRFVDSSDITGYSQEQVSKMPVDEIFRRSTDGPECPMSRCWSSNEFISMCKEAGFSKVQYMGGYPFWTEGKRPETCLTDAINDKRLEEEHKEFLKQVTIDARYGME